MDEKSTFFHGEFKEIVYMVQPYGYEQFNQKDFIANLKKPYMGLDKHLECGTRELMGF